VVFALKARLQVLELRFVKLEFCHNKLGVEQWINLQLTGKNSLRLDSNSSLLLEYGVNYKFYFFNYRFRAEILQVQSIFVNLIENFN